MVALLSGPGRMDRSDPRRGLAGSILIGHPRPIRLTIH